MKGGCYSQGWFVYFMTGNAGACVYDDENDPVEKGTLMTQMSGSQGRDYIEIMVRHIE